LFAASDAVDTDFTAKLVDICPDGPSINLCEGIVRARHRRGADRVDPIEPGEVVEYHIDLQPTANVFRARHRIGIEISSSNFPAFDRNLNTGDPIASAHTPVVARQRVHHGGAASSRLMLSVRTTGSSQTH
jgi:putative CocE/NonD family hydrolase